jgi:ubiquinone/menaquinone biosynthesis C-methylase UbiE
MFDARSPVGLLNKEMDTLTGQILSEVVLENENWLDLGCGLKPFKSFFAKASYTGLDVESSGACKEMKIPDLYFDGKKIPFSDEFFDGILCTQVLEHAIDSDALIVECSRVLKKSGKIVLSVPFIQREHEQPFDFRRFTSFGILSLLEDNGFSVVKNTKILSPIETIATLFVTYVTNTYGSRTKWSYRLITYFLVAPTLILVKLFPSNKKENRDLYCVLIVLAKKDNQAIASQ